MKRPKLIHKTALFFCMGLSAQEGPNLFQLKLPDFFDTWLASSDTLVELPDRRLQRMTILVRKAQDRNINPGRYKILVNGKGIGNIFDERTTPDVTLLVMEPETLRKRPDEIFDPRENAIEVTAEDRRGRRYYQNWVLRTNDGKQNALFAYSSSVSGEPRSVPPDLVITEPALPPVLKEGQASARVILKGMLSAEATLRVDGQPVALANGGPVRSFEYSAKVVANQREILLEASDGRGNSRKAVIPVFGPPAAAPHIRFPGQKYAVVIGISRFGAAKSSPPPLLLAAADATEFARRLEMQAGFRHENIRLLTDEKATIEMVRVALSDFAAKAQSNDLLIVYFATHGLHDPRPNRGDRLFLALNGTQVGLMDSTALSFSDLELLLNRSVRTNQCFLIFDVGHALDDDWRFRAGRNLVNNHVLNMFGDKPGWSILVAGSADEVSNERSVHSGTSSLFSYWLNEALSGAADLNGDRVVTAKELFSFVSERVRTESNGTQHPRFRLAGRVSELPMGERQN